MSKTKIWDCTKNNFVLKKKFDVAQKVILFRQKRVMYFTESISCRQKQDDAASKKYFGRKKVIIFSGTARHKSELKGKIFYSEFNKKFLQ